MRFQFKSKHLERLFTEEHGAHLYSEGVVSSFFEVMAIIESAKNCIDIRAFKSLRLEKLKGDRLGQHSLRLNKRYRLIVEINDEEREVCIHIIEIIDYH